ncbi:MAG TPA: SurA N-terminal domain-containing protein [Longimicrobiales bacterium]|nr:SurA N-terminal domain-containing protein [Longimicrobiales bacterium]
MMRQMRENTKWIMLITALAFVGLMVFEWGMDMSGQSGAQLQGGEIGSIDGEPITFEEYDRFYRELYQRRQAETQEPISPAENRELEDQAWEQLVTDRLLRRELSRLGIRATDQEVLQAARYAPPPTFASNALFQTDGEFDFDKYHAFLSSPMTDPALLAELEAYYRDVIPRNRLFQRVAAGIYTPEPELWRMYRDRNETASIRYVMLEPARVVPNAAVTVTEEDIKAYYEAHREDFRQDARAQIRYVTLDARPGTEDSAAARDRAFDLRQQIVEEGADFGEVARVESADPASASRDGDVGLVRRADLPPSFAETAWSVPIGQVSLPVETQFGFHLVRVRERTDSTARLSQILIPIELTREHEDLILTRADSLEVLTENFTLERAAQDLGLAVREANVTRAQPFVPGAGSLDDGVYWAFNTAEAESEISPLFEADGMYYVIELVRRTPERVPPLEEARAAIRLRVQAQKKLERARLTARDMIDRVRQGATLEDVAAAHELQVQEAGPFTRVDFVPGIGRANAVVGAAFGLDRGKVSGVVEENDALYIVQLIEKSEASRREWEAQKDQQGRMVTAALEEARIRQFMEELRTKAEILDRRQEARAAANAPQTPTSPFF